jgi:hypothetical protein
MVIILALLSFSDTKTDTYRQRCLDDVVETMHFTAIISAYMKLKLQSLIQTGIVGVMASAIA